MTTQESHTTTSNNFFMPILLTFVSIVVITGTFYEEAYRNFLGLQTHETTAKNNIPLAEKIETDLTAEVTNDPVLNNEESVTKNILSQEIAKNETAKLQSSESPQISSKEVGASRTDMAKDSDTQEIQTALAKLVTKDQVITASLQAPSIPTSAIPTSSKTLSVETVEINTSNTNTHEVKQSVVTDTTIENAEAIITTNVVDDARTPETPTIAPTTLSYANTIQTKNAQNNLAQISKPRFYNKQNPTQNVTQAMPAPQNYNIQNYPTQNYLSQNYNANNFGAQHYPYGNTSQVYSQPQYTNYEQQRQQNYAAMQQRQRADQQAYRNEMQARHQQYLASVQAQREQRNKVKEASEANDMLAQRRQSEANQRIHQIQEEISQLNEEIHQLRFNPENVQKSTKTNSTPIPTSKQM